MATCLQDPSLGNKCVLSQTIELRLFPTLAREEKGETSHTNHSGMRGSLNAVL